MPSFLLAIASLFVGHPAEVVSIKHVIDSNTLIVEAADGASLTVDLAGVGTPETIDPKKPLYLLGVKDPGWIQRHLLAGTKVLMENVGETSTGRPLVVIYRLSDRLCWNAWLIEVGGAFFTTTTLVDYSSKEEMAQSKRSGLWTLAPKPADVAEIASAAYSSSDPSRRLGVESSSRSPNRVATVQSFNLKNYPKRRLRPRYQSQPGAWDEFDAVMDAFMSTSFQMAGYGASSMAGYGVNSNQHITPACK